MNDSIAEMRSPLQQDLARQAAGSAILGDELHAHMVAKRRGVCAQDKVDMATMVVNQAVSTGIRVSDHQQHTDPATDSVPAVSVVAMQETNCVGNEG